MDVLRNRAAEALDVVLVGRHKRVQILRGPDLELRAVTVLLDADGKDGAVLEDLDNLLDVLDLLGLNVSLVRSKPFPFLVRCHPKKPSPRRQNKTTGRWFIFSRNTSVKK